VAQGVGPEFKAQHYTHTHTHTHTQKQAKQLYPSWLLPVILATWEAEIRRITVEGQLRETAQENSSPKQRERKGIGDMACGSSDGAPALQA
jgi:hypothetical protein